MRQINQLRTGVILSYVNLAIGCLIPFLYTPIMLDMLGQAEYGLYSLASSVVGYLSLLTFGFGSTIIRYVAKYRAEGKIEEVEKAFGFFLMLYVGLAVLVFVGGWILSGNVDRIFEKGLTAAEIDKVKTLTILMAFNMALSFPISVFSSMITACERYLFRRIVDIISSVAAPVLNLIALYMGFASVGMTLAATVLQILMMPVNVIYCCRVLKLRPRFARIPRAVIREMLGFSFYVFIGTIVDMLFWATDKVILGMIASSVAVAVYNVGGTFNHMVIQLSTAISGVLTPRITGMVATDTAKENLSELFIRVGRLQYFVIALIVSGFSVFGKAFIQLWSGPEYEQSFWIAVLTMFPLCIPLIQNTGISILMAQNKHRFRSLLYLVIAIANVIATYLIVPYWGGIGAALCSCVSYLLGQGLIMNIYYHKVTGLNIPLFWKNILGMSWIPAVMLAVGLKLKDYILMDNWLVFFLGVIVYSGIYVVLMYCFTLNRYEKDVIRQPVQKIISKLTKK
jgi:O-antigen/teichoic acid export membrane protein